jgi:hypothetical protein
MYYHIESNFQKSSFRTVYQLLHKEQRPHYDGTGIYRWPPLHRPGVTRTAHQQRDRLTGPLSPALTLNSDSPLTLTIHHHHPSPSITINHLQPPPASSPSPLVPSTRSILDVHNTRASYIRAIPLPLLASRDKHSYNGGYFRFQSTPPMSTILSYTATPAGP